MFRASDCHSAVANRLLSTLPVEEVEHLLPSLEPVTFALGKVVCEPGERLNNVYFPTTSVVSFLHTMADGATAETGLVGNDGMVGITLVLGGETTPNRAVVQVAGDAFRMRATSLAREFARGGPLQRSLLRYTQALITQISQTAVCNVCIRCHTPQSLAAAMPRQSTIRWLPDDTRNLLPTCWADVVRASPWLHAIFKTPA